MSLLLGLLPPELAHSLGLRLLRLYRPPRIERHPELVVETRMGTLSNPLGLAAGFDKDGIAAEALSRLGLGYIVLGTVTRDARPGNPRPRLARRRRERALVNALGFPNRGVDRLVERLSSTRLSCPVAISISGDELEGILYCYKEAQEHSAAVELNLSSPNTPSLSSLREVDRFREIAEQLRVYKRRPTYLKIPPYASKEEGEKVLGLVKTWWELGFEGVTAVNTLPVEDRRMAIGIGGLSGPPLIPYMLRAVRDIREATMGELEINAVGGISSGMDALRAIASGASTVQIFTALVYGGAGIVPRILSEMLGAMRRLGYGSISELRERGRRRPPPRCPVATPLSRPGPCPLGRGPAQPSDPVSSLTCPRPSHTSSSRPAPCV